MASSLGIRTALAATRRAQTSTNGSTPWFSCRLILRAPKRRFHAKQHESKLLLPRTVMAVSAAAGMALCTFTTKSTAHCAAAVKRPMRFGTSLRSFVSASDERDDCPICKKYSQGPCGEFFKEWLKCTDDHPGPSASNPEEEDHVQKCLHLAKPLAACLEEHQDYYEKIDLDYSIEENEADELELQHAWNEVIQRVEQANTAQPFESRRPQLEVRLEDFTGMAVFSLQLRGAPLVFGYVKDQDGVLLAAGSQEDLWDYHEGWGLLRLKLPQDAQSITAYALYSESENEDALYSFTQRLPPRVENDDS